MYFNTQPIFTAKSNRLETLKEWRNYEGSLTDKLQDAKGEVEVQLLYQNWIKTTWWDTHVLNIQDAQIVQREIIMSSLGLNYWYARTIIPKKCYTLDPIFFKRLEKETLKNLIFGEQKVQRVSMRSYPVDKECIEFQWVKKYIKLRDEPLWVRLAEYSFLNIESFYLAEILLPELESV
jgi:chorismate-pyruvate lyase